MGSRRSRCRFPQVCDRLRRADSAVPDSGRGGASVPVPLGQATVLERRLTLNRRTVVFRDGQPNGASRLFMALVDSPRVVTALQTSTAVERNIDVSPDSRWLAYVSNETGSEAVYVSVSCRRAAAASGSI